MNCVPHEALREARSKTEYQKHLKGKLSSKITLHVPLPTEINIFLNICMDKTRQTLILPQDIDEHVLNPQPPFWKEHWQTALPHISKIGTTHEKKSFNIKTISKKQLNHSSRSGFKLKDFGLAPFDIFWPFLLLQPHHIFQVAQKTKTKFQFGTVGY